MQIEKEPNCSRFLPTKMLWEKALPLELLPEKVTHVLPRLWAAMASIIQPYACTDRYLCDVRIAGVQTGTEFTSQKYLFTTTGSKCGRKRLRRATKLASYQIAEST
jgi:hypothetical protein